MLYKRGSLLKCRDKHVVLMEDFDSDAKGYLILNFWEQCDYKDINVLPVSFAKCENDREYYQLKKDNIIVGRVDEFCLI